MTLPTPFLTFSRDSWSRLRASTPMTLTESDLVALRGINEDVSLDEVADIYLPLSRLLNLHVDTAQKLYRATDDFLGHQQSKVPYVIGLGGSVAVGKSTTARILRELLARWPDHPKVDLVTTDGFLFPNRVLRERQLMQRKGFPESYDLGALVRFLAAVKSGEDEVTAPVYSHQVYDIVEGSRLTVRRPDVVIVEGLNVLQTGTRASTVFVSDFFDFSIYVDADPKIIRRWYVERFQDLRRTVFTDPHSYFHRYSHLDEDQALETAGRIWDQINGPNLQENIAPTRERADLILEKGPEHGVQRVRLRRL